MTIRDRIVEIRKVPARELMANPLNFRLHPSPQKEAMAGALRELGAADVLKVYKNPDGVLTLLDGHLRQDIAPDFEWTCIVLDFNEEESLTYIATHDAITDMAEIDKDILTGVLDDVKTFEPGLADLLAKMAKENKIHEEIPPGDNDPPLVDKADELQKKWKVKVGDIWTLGDHRIVCGDCTDKAVIDGLMMGHSAHLCITDPPYNVSYGENPAPSRTNQNRQDDELDNDRMTDEQYGEWMDNVVNSIHEVLRPGAVLYMCMAMQYFSIIDPILRVRKFHWSSTIIWAKDSFVMIRKDYHSQYEPMWYGWKEGAARLVELDDRTQSDIWQITRPKRSDEHPTMKPVPLFARAIINSSRKGDIVYEPFAGSGTAIIAADATDRICYAAEIAPRYVSVCLERWSNHTGKKPERSK
jgi:DNA modification methylase